MQISDSDKFALQEAKQQLEHPNFMIKLSHRVGQPIETLIDKLPGKAHNIIMKTTEKTLNGMMKGALLTLKEDKITVSPSNRFHKTAVMLSGAVSGLFGMAGLAWDLPFSTSVILRSIADIARSEGESLRDPDTKLACLSVLALGGKSKDDDAAESAYWSVRATLAKSINDASQHLVMHAATDTSTPVLVKLINKVAEKFSIQVTEKFLAQAVPVVGMIGGASVNWLFIQHFQGMAKAHFTIRRLEREYGERLIKQLYNEV